MAVISGQVGAGGAQTNPVRQASDFVVETADFHGRYTNAVLNGNCYGVFDTAGAQLPSGLSTAPVTVSLYNPLGSGVNLVLLYAELLLTVVTVAIAAVWIGINPTGAAPTTGTKKTTQNMNGSGGQGKIQALTTATLPAVPTIIGTLGVAATGAVNLLPSFPGLFKWFDGIIQVGPGGALSFQMSQVSAAAAGWGGWIWEEISTAVVV